MEDSPNETCEVPSVPAPRLWRLRAIFQGKERIRSLKRGDTLVLGSGDSADFSLDDPTVSQLHCRLEVGDYGLRITDLNSTNGTYVGTGRVTDAVLGGPRACFVIGCTSVEAEERGVSLGAHHLGLIGESESMMRVRERIRRFARLRAPVLIVGESGTGKDLVARALHVESGRQGDYLPLNVAALPDSLMDAELFGHEKGAFTGAIGSRTGLFELAEGGTLFLDEIAEMSAAGQAKLLRVVEDGRVRALGAPRDRSVQVRIVSATCAPLQERIEQERFRGDLYHRLSTLSIELPPLRHRSGDIPKLAESFLAKVASELGPKRLLPSTLEVLKKAPWPGNVRELFGVLYRAAALTHDDALGPGHLQIAAKLSNARPKLLADRALELLDIHGNMSAAARAAGVPRTTFRSVLERRKGVVSQPDESR